MAAPTPAATPAHHARRRRHRIAALVALPPLVVVLLLAAWALWVGHRALEARDALQSAQHELVAFRSALGRAGGPSTVQLSRTLRADTGRAVRMADDPLWAMSERLPVVGPDLVAVRQLSGVVNALVVDGIGPVAVAADGLSTNSLKPHDGRLDIRPLQRLTPAVSTLDAALRTADTADARIDRTRTAPQIGAAADRLHAAIGEALPVTAELKKVMPLLYPALGGTGVRHYLLVFQNNAEERASGGNPAALAMLDVDDGRITLGRQPNSQDFPHPYPYPVASYGGQWDRLYGPHVTTFETNITFTPDFPTVAKLARTMWQRQFPGRVDGVVSLDPVALSYLLRATGPIRLKTGETLTSHDAVSFLLSGVYAEYRNTAEQNVVFADAAQAVFTAVTHGRGTPADYLKELAPMLQEQRLKAWSVRKDEEAALLTSPAGNMLPRSNASRTTVGVYDNDDATSKMSYYVGETIAATKDLCRPDSPRYTVSATLTDRLTVARAQHLSHYVLAAQSRIPFAGDRQWVQIFGPVGSTLTSATVGGRPVVFGTDQDWRLNTVSAATGQDVRRPAVSGRIYGRPVAIVSVTLGPTESLTVTAHFRGATGPLGPLAVSHTPRVRDVPVTQRRASCG